MPVKKYFISQTSIVLLVLLLVATVYPSIGQYFSYNNQKVVSASYANHSLNFLQAVEEDEVEKSLQEDQLLFNDQQCHLYKLEVSYVPNSQQEVDSFFYRYLFCKISAQAP